MLVHVIITILTILVPPFVYRAVVCLRRNIRVFRLLVEARLVPCSAYWRTNSSPEPLEAPVMRTHEVTDVVIVVPTGSLAQNA